MGRTLDKARAAIAKVDALGDEAGRIFTRLDRDRILAEAEEADARASASPEPLPLAGMLVSVKDLYDEAGERTTAGSRLLAEHPAARADCPVVRRMKAAGAVMFGRTTMSEFAYSGVGLNPHYGTPGAVFDRSRIPGGSTSGGALTVARGLCDIALGTDTGGSVRIPAAVNGLYGFKPTQASVPLAGVHPLSKTLDSAGPLAADFATVAAAYAVMSGTERPSATARTNRRLAVPRGAFVDDLDAAVASGHAATLRALEAAGHELVDIDLTFLGEAIGLNRIIVAAEAHALYRKDLARLEQIGDPRVLARIRFADTLSPQQVEDAYAARRVVVDRFGQALAEVDALVAPTLQIAVPTIAETEANFDRINAAMLRNPSLINLADGCALTVPLFRSGERGPQALMLAAPGGRDWALLDCAEALLPSLQ